MVNFPFRYVFGQTHIIRHFSASVHTALFAALHPRLRQLLFTVKFCTKVLQAFERGCTS